MTRPRRFLRAIGPAGLVLALSSGAAAQAEDAEIRALFLSNCAQCHGETGDGQGTTTLDRPARSFKDGGFSYGNTPEALFRTISMGIPGTPMPAFDSALDEEKRRALAEYVITLGPEIREVSEEDMVLVVRDRPLVVRGKLPPIAEGALEHPRGLLIGTTDGFTFEYQADDVRLIGVRQGDFVRRSDWVGRGGTGLEPLGKVVCLVEGGTPRPTFYEGETPLRARLESTRIADGEPWVHYSLRDGIGRVRADVRETLDVPVTPLGAMFVRRIEVQGGPSALDLELALPRGADESLVMQGGGPGHVRAAWLAEGTLLGAAIVLPEKASERARRSDGFTWPATLAPGETLRVEIELIAVAEAPEADRDATLNVLREILSR
jgi:mono/diheme cytochrome c family protein